MSRLRAAGFGPELIPGALALVVFVVWALAEGGFDPGAWYPGALFLGGLLVAVWIPLRRSSVPIQRPAALALAALAAFTVWAFASIGWADARGDAWDGANRTLLYLSVFALFLLPRWRAASAALLLGAFALATAAVGALVLLGAAASDDPTLSFIHGSLSEPTGYHNSTAALFLGGIFAAVALAARREVPWPARGLMLAAAGVLVELTVLAQSRGSLIALPIALAIYLVAVPRRARALIALLPVAAAAAIAAPALLDVYPAARDGSAAAPGAIDDALAAIGWSFAALLATGLLGAFADSRIDLPGTAARAGRAAVGIAAGAALVVAGVVGVGAAGNPVTWAGDRWEEFKAGEEEGALAETRFTGGLGTNRYDFWRVAAGELAERPLTGAGVESFAVAYVRERRSDEEPLHPHSLPVRIATQTGVVGSLLFGAWLVLALAAAIRTRARLGDGLGAAVWAAAIAGVAYWFAHSSADWFWAFPALTAPAIAWLALAIRIDPERPSAPVRRPRPGTVAIALAALVALAAAASYLLPWAAGRDVEAAAANWGADPAAAYERLDRARSLNFLSEQPDLVAGTIAVRLDQLPRARDAFDAALERQPEGWYPRLMLGAIAARQGDRATALAELREARELNPRDPLVRSLLDDARAGRRVSFESIERSLLDRVCERVGRIEGTEEVCP